MDTVLMFWIAVSSILYGVTEGVTCVKKYSDERERIFECDTCCGGDFTRYCCEADFVPEVVDRSVDPVTSVIIFGVIFAVIAIIIAIVLAVFYFKCGDKRLGPDHASRPPTLVLHEASIEDEEAYVYSISDDSLDSP